MMPKLWWVGFACALTQDCGQDRPHLGWLAHPPGERAQRLSAAEAQPNGRHLEQLPDYAPDLNPDEGIWNYREAGLNWAMSVVPTSTTSIVKLFAPKSACSTKRRSSSAALANVVTWFRFLLQDQ
jgi:hypothetical protein